MKEYVVQLCARSNWLLNANACSWGNNSVCLLSSFLNNIIKMINLLYQTSQINIFLFIVHFIWVLIKWQNAVILLTFVQDCSGPQKHYRILNSIHLIYYGHWMRFILNSIKNFLKIIKAFRLVLSNLWWKIYA